MVAKSDIGVFKQDSELSHCCAPQRFNPESRLTDASAEHKKYMKFFSERPKW